MEMARRKTLSSSEALRNILLGAQSAEASIPSNVWIRIDAGGLVAAAIYALARSEKAFTPPSTAAPRPAQAPIPQPSVCSARARRSSSRSVSAPCDEFLQGAHNLDGEVGLGAALDPTVRDLYEPATRCRGDFLLGKSRLKRAIEGAIKTCDSFMPQTFISTAH